MKKVGIVMGSDSDLPIIKKATAVLDDLGIPYTVNIYSAHRTPEQARDFSLNARANGYGALIAAAGMAAHLAGAVAANTTLPDIGIPCASSYLDGMDALLSTVQMPQVFLSLQLQLMVVLMLRYLLLRLLPLKTRSLQINLIKCVRTQLKLFSKKMQTLCLN